MHGAHPHRRLVGGQAGGRFIARGGGPGDEPGVKSVEVGGVRPEQQLTDPGQVRQVAFPVPEPGQVGTETRQQLTDQRGHPTGREAPGQLVDPLRRGGFVASGQQVGGGQAEQLTQGGLEDAGAGRPGDGGEHRQPVGHGRGVEGGTGTVPGGGQSRRAQLGDQGQAPAAGPGEDRDVPGADGPFPSAAAEPRPGQQRPHVRHHVVRHCAFRVFGGPGAVPAQPDAGRGGGVENQDLLIRGSGGTHGGDPDVRIAQAEVPEQVRHPRDHPGFAPVVGLQGGAVPDHPRGLQVGAEIRAAEAVDRLLGIADQRDHRVRVHEGAPQDGPLVRVGVLELVDQHHGETAPELCTHLLGDRGVGDQGPQPARQVVEADQPQGAPARRETGPHPFLEVQQLLVGRGEGKPRRGRCGGDQKRAARVQRRVGVMEVAGQVLVGGALAHQGGDVGGHLVGAVPVPQHPQALQLSLAERVDGGDRRGPEVVQGNLEPFPVALDVAVRPEQPRYRVHRFGAARQQNPQIIRNGSDPGVDPPPQLHGGRIAEGDEQKLSDSHSRLGDVACRETRYGPGLARSGAGLQQHRAIGQGIGDLERNHRAASRRGECRASAQPPKAPKRSGPAGSPSWGGSVNSSEAGPV